jgi:hypothetical protein
LLIRYLLGLHEQEAGVIKVVPVMPQALRRVGAAYRVGPLRWGKYQLHIECTVRDVHSYTMHVSCSVQPAPAVLAMLAPEPVQEAVEQQWEWEGAWGEERILQLP